MTPSQEYININKRIQRIKEKGLTPITLKSPSDITQKFMYEKGTGKEGLIMSYNEASFMANTRNETLTVEEYNKSIEVFMNSYAEQTYVQGAYNEAYERAKGVIHFISENINDINPDFDIDKLSKKDVVEMLKYAGERMNELKDAEQMNYKNGNSPTDFLDFIDQWYSEHKGE